MKILRSILILLASVGIANAQVQQQISNLAVTTQEIVGTTGTPATKLEVVDTGTATPRGITNSQYSTGTDSAQFNARKSRGTKAAPTTVVSGDLLGRLLFWGYDGANFIETSNIRVTSEGTIAATRVPSKFEIFVGTNAAPTVVTSTASFSGKDGITLTAVGTNQSITLTPSGTGSVVAVGNIVPDATGTRSLGTTAPLVWDVVNANNFRTAGGTLSIKNTFTGAGGDPAFATDTTAATITSGTASLISLLTPFSPTSGTGVWNWINIAPTINQTGGANGITRGIYINPTLTAAADYRGLEIASAGTSKFIANGSGLVTTYNGIATAGNGVVSVQGAGRVTAQTAANASIATYTVGAADASFLVSVNVNVTTATAHNFTVTCAYTDEGNTSRTITIAFTQLTASTLLTAITNVTGAGPYESFPLHLRCKAATAITIASTGTFTTVTYNAEGIIYKLQ